ncbi:hypothetical protein QTP86_021348 [Hemibagrus guttatus]|nr:hypothetical protein QTP86_021348 [Hemibagrus guttatus]
MADKKRTWTLRLCVLLGSILIMSCIEGAESGSVSLLESLRLPSDTEYEIVAPYEVDRHGRYVSHAVAHHHRRRRSLDERGIDPASTAHFRLHGLGQNFHMELRPSVGLVAPGFTVQTLGENGMEKLETFPREEFCFYQGSLRSKVNSTVALSTCAGMSGLIRTEDADYFLKPLLLHQLQHENYTSAHEHHPHILYRIHTHALERRGGAKRRHRRHSHHDDYGHGAHRKQHYCGRRKKYMPQPPAEDVYISPDEYKPAARGRRAATPMTYPRLNVETLVVVDQKMMENHGRENVTTFVLTVLNMVSTLFKDRTIGGDINVVIVGLILLSSEQDGLVINHHADHTLSSFCQWQSALAGREGRRHDHAILLTGLDICSWKNEPCDTLGFAPISGMCSKYRSCTVNEDTGLGLAFTIAHESGHNFGMIHDGEGNVCKKSIGNIMSPTLAGDNGLFSWSPCSRQYLTRFLSTAQATCLSDEPKAMKEYKYPEKLPGELYDTDTQCKWQFGEKAKLCTLSFKKARKLSDICKALWCHRAGRKCETKFMPAAEGSSCGPEMGAGGNWATVGRRSRGGRRVHRQREKRKGKSVGLRIGTLNVGTMTGKGRELADMMERRKVDILCVQETRWKGSKARSIGAGFKLFYYGVDSKRNGVGVVLKEEFVRNVLEVKRVSDRVMSLKLEIEGVMLNVVSGYAPQVGCELEEKERFWSELDEVIESIPTGERVVIGTNFNGHVGEGNTGDEEVMGKFGVKERNLEGQMVVDFAKRMDMGVVNTYFQKREEHRVTYKSGGRRTQVDYILCRRGNLKEISDCKVVVGESVARQHRMVVCRVTLMVCKTKRSKIEKKTKWWKLKKEECCEEFRQKLRQALGGQVVLPDDWETTAEVIRETGRKVLGVSSGRRKEDKETWWWNEEVQDSIQRKRLAKKKWDMDRTEENRQEYKELQRRVKRGVSKAKQKAYDELYTRLDTREGEKDLYRLARQRDRDGKDVQQVRVIKDRDGRVLTSEESVQRRWKEYFEELMNEENEREKRVERVNSVEQKVDKIRKDEVRKALKSMKSGKAVGPDDIPVEVWKCLGEAAVEFLASLFNRVLESERMPEEWRSVLVPIFKNKGDVQSCNNYRGIKLMSHTMKLWERVVEARLRKVVEICEQQYGFMPRKSTTDAIFALRILMEKYRDGQRELHCVFVDLEKAYDGVPREELWYCMRKSGVAEKYVRVVQDMYERSRTVVRCAVGQTEEFNVEVGLHQGSALSPFLFAIVMDQLSEEVRQESPWTMMFSDDIVICSESREQVEENLERWRFVLERRGMKVSRSKTEYMCVNEREGSGTVRLQGEEVKKVQEFKYLGSTVQSNGECGKEVKKRVQAGWNGWRKVSGVLCDQKISARIKGKVYRTVVRPAMLYGLETVSLRKRQESELEWCRRGECVKWGAEGPQPAYSHWSEWSDWSTCSRTCESGVMYRERQCNHHEHMDVGSVCEGMSREYKLCNTFDCPASAVDFRAAQCTEFNTKPFRGLYYRWKPYTQYKDHELCKLYCFAEGYDFFYALSNKVRDGTRCMLDSNNVCIDGVCEKVGCDKELGSTAVMDMCGVCNGKNSTCKLYKGRYTKQHYSNQYYGVVTIPPGARSIRVVESNSSRSFLALRNAHGKYYLNGHWKVDWPGRYSIAGSVFDYKRPYNGLESLTSTGPTSEALVVEILLQGLNPGVRWEYTLNKTKTEKVTKPKHKYTWAVIRGECSATCAGGEMKTKSTCYKDQRVQVNTSYCNPKTRPKTGTVSCNTQPCPPRWSVGDWRVCSRTCGSGEQSRQVQCVQTASHTRVKVLSDEQCVQPPPERTHTCNTHTCPPTWSVGTWTQCSRKCGKGVQRRAVMCVRRTPGLRDLVLPDSECVFLPKPHSMENCVLKPCPRTHTTHWSLTHWQQCSVTCGVGVQFRSLQCVEKDVTGKHRTLAEKKCQHTPKPSAELQRVCVQPDCINTHRSHTAQWYTSTWSQCTVSCGGGVQVRSVQCLLHRRPSPTCSLHVKPAASQICNTNFCPQQNRDHLCKDSYGWCHLVQQHGVCTHHLYRTQCCLSCSNTNF